jgi:hypothetical protein
VRVAALVAQPGATSGNSTWGLEKPQGIAPWHSQVVWRWTARCLLGICEQPGTTRLPQLEQLSRTLGRQKWKPEELRLLDYKSLDEA